MPSRNAGTRASDAGKRGACCRGTQGARGDACWGTRDACCRSLGPCCKRGKGHALPHPHRRPRTRGLRSAQGKPVMADAGRGRACRRDARGACCGGGTRARAHAEKRACQRHKKVFSHLLLKKSAPQSRHRYAVLLHYRYRCGSVRRGLWMSCELSQVSLVTFV